MKKKILVIGNANMNFILPVKRMPRANETTVEDGRFDFSSGGRGAVAATAVAKLGGESVFCARIGGDGNGSRLMKLYADCGIDTRYVVVDRARRTGLCTVITEESGDTRTLYYPGANSRLSSFDAEEAFSSLPDGLVMQMEASESTISDACSVADDKGVPIFLDGGPSRPGFPFYRLPMLEVFAPDETETQAYTDILPDTLDKCLRAAVRLATVVKARYYVLKLGGRGAFVYDGKYCQIIPAQEIDVVDGRGAGDAFTAALALEYLRSGDIVRAAKYANVVGAMTTLKEGLCAAVPTAAELAEYVRKNNIVIE